MIEITAINRKVRVIMITETGWAFLGTFLLLESFNSSFELNFVVAQRKNRALNGLPYLLDSTRIHACNTNEVFTCHGIHYLVGISMGLSPFLNESMKKMMNLVFVRLSYSANVGGAFGLCLGASIISFIEIIYFVVVRVFGRILTRKYTNRKKPSATPVLRMERPEKVMKLPRFHQYYNKDIYYGSFLK